MSSDLSHLPQCFARLCKGMTVDASCIDSVGFVKSVLDADVLRDVPIGQMHIVELLLCTIVNRPAHYVHQSRITKGCTPFDFQFDFSTVVRLMTGLTQCDKVVRGVPAGLTGLNMMYIENLVLRFPVAVLTFMTVTEHDILTYIPEPHLFSLLILFSLYVGIFEQLRIELCHFDDCLRNREDAVHLPDEMQMRVDGLFYGRSKPAVRSSAVVESWGTVACLTVASCPSCFPASSEKACNIPAESDFGGEEFSLFSCCRQSDMSGSCINAQSYGLRVFFRIIEQLDCKRFTPYNTGLALTEKVSDLTVTACRHQCLA